MRVDAYLSGADTTRDAATAAGRAEAAGIDGVWMGEIDVDPFLPLAAVAGSTSSITLGTGVHVAFSRSPVSVAHTAHDLQRLSGGRFVLGLGTQVRAHVERRFGMAWPASPVGRLREYVAAVRAVWRCWDEGEPLDFQGDHYRLSLMKPPHLPPANPHGPPPVFLAAVGPAMATMAGEVADGVFTHRFSTPAYLRDVLVPMLGARREQMEVVSVLTVATGRDEPQVAAATEAARQMVARYGTTAAYRPVFAHHGWEALADELDALVRARRFDDLPAAVPDDVVGAFVTVAPLEELPAALVARYGGTIDRVAVALPADVSEEERAAFVAAVHAAPPA